MYVYSTRFMFIKVLYEYKKYLLYIDILPDSYSVRKGGRHSVQNKQGALLVGGIGMILIAREGKYNEGYVQY